MKNIKYWKVVLSILILSLLLLIAISLTYNTGMAIKAYGKQDNIELGYETETLRWQPIPETAWYEAPQSTRLPDDVLVEYGKQPIMSSSYNVGDVVRIVYLENNMKLYFMVEAKPTYQNV